jgi:hypothetical protein
MESTWASRELPVLNAVVTLLDRPDAFMVRVIDIAEHTGLKPTTVAKALDALEGPYVGEFTKGLTGGVADTWYVAQVTASARQAVGQWPTAENVLAQLVDGLNDAADFGRYAIMDWSRGIFVAGADDGNPPSTA